jgi:hypothetical protein
MENVKAKLDALVLQECQEPPNDIIGSLRRGGYLNDSDDLGKKLQQIVERMRPAEALSIYKEMFRAGGSVSSTLGLKSIQLLLEWDKKHPIEHEKVVPAGPPPE